ncbi:putative tenascin-X-like [Apostichopus japonicus]|uniref:Putative tenascin-X-like n=1 Tax=Stichopus japonicus TaxID=307972 RepID=A0A2G8K0K1_STIJA|nr:putative tenascin-X-like [Apostichopus japonicus]
MYIVYSIAEVEYHIFLFLNSRDDALNYHRNMSFSTSDADHECLRNCAASHGGAGGSLLRYSNLNGRYGVEEDAGAVEWSGMPGGSYALKFTEMKIRP